MRTPKTYSQCIGEDYGENNILRKNAMTEDFDPNFSEYWVKCGKSFKSQLALIRTAASNGLFNDSSSKPSLAWNANRADPRDKLWLTRLEQLKLTRRLMGVAWPHI